jgi:hypothetical protein
LPILPRKPTSDLRVGGEKKNVTCSDLAEFQGHDEACVIGVALQRQREFRRWSQPVAVNPSPLDVLLRLLVKVERFEERFYAFNAIWRVLPSV